MEPTATLSVTAVGGTDGRRPLLMGAVAQLGVGFFYGWCRVVGGNSLAALSEQMIVGRVRRRGQAWQVGLAEPRSPIH